MGGISLLGVCFCFFFWCRGGVVVVCHLGLGLLIRFIISVLARQASKQAYVFKSTERKNIYTKMRCRFGKSIEGRGGGGGNLCFQLVVE